MRGMTQSEIFGIPPFSPHFGHGPWHGRHHRLNFMGLERIGWVLRQHGYEHCHGKHDHHDHRGGLHRYHGHHDGPLRHHSYHDGPHGHHSYHDGPHGHHGHRGGTHRHNDHHHCSRKLRSPSPECRCGPRYGSPDPQDRSLDHSPKRPEDSSPERRDCEGFRRKGKRCRGSMHRGPCGRSPYDCCTPRSYKRSDCCKKHCEKKKNESSGNECDKANDNEPNCIGNRTNDAVLYERVVVENNPRGSSV